MRVLAILSLLILSGCTYFVDPVRIESFAAGANGTFTYRVATNTVLTENDDGEGEEIRRGWLRQDLEAHGLCAKGYAIDSRNFVQPGSGVFANGGAILYRGHCLN